MVLGAIGTSGGIRGVGSVLGCIGTGRECRYS